MTTTHRAGGIDQVVFELRQKCGSFSRCFKEYGTYLDELESDKERLEALKAEGKEVRQQEQVIAETTAMIGITESNAQKMARQFLDFWRDAQPQLAAPELDRKKASADCHTLARMLSKTLPADLPQQRVPIDSNTLEEIRVIHKQLQNIGEKLGDQENTPVA